MDFGCMWEMEFEVSELEFVMPELDFVMLELELELGRVEFAMLELELGVVRDLPLEFRWMVLYLELPMELRLEYEMLYAAP